ncbi:MAG: Crp/Fnr family transcriptional regulator [Deltaproteobacteria bacterium]|nr:Crp/Fnr family transcriptional regulator [Deltaproteobacteria bacterium]
MKSKAILVDSPSSHRHPSRRQPLCPDCPAVRNDGLSGLVSLERGCSLQWVALAARQPLPTRWPGTYALALVRRGIVVRQRIDGNGQATAIDVVGPGGAFVVEEGHPESTTGGYAATEAMVCLCPEPVAADGLANDGETARDLWKLAKRSLERVERIADARSRATAKGRVAALLGAVADTLGGRPTEVVPAGIQQRDLAALIAVRHESVCRVLRTFVDRGWVRREPEGIRLLDRKGLASAGNR